MTSCVGPLENAVGSSNYMDLIPNEIADSILLMANKPKYKNVLDEMLLWLLYYFTH